MSVLDHVEFLVEELSAEEALYNLVPKILGQDVSFTVYPHQGKLDLLKKLPSRLRGYRAWLPENAGIVVLIDADGKDCREQKAELEDTALRAGFLTRSSAQGRRFQVLNRLAVEELEAWFFGDVGALRAAYPGISSSLGERAGYRDPDAIRGGTWEALERELQRAGHHRAGLAKIKAAREISAHMEPARNRSRSFQTFRQGLLDLAGTG
jgi:uncharacterized protein DUF4276